VNQEKVKLPKDVAESIEWFRKEFAGYEWTIMSAILRYDANNPVSEQEETLRDFIRKSESNFTVIMKALVNGYEIEKSPDDLIHDLFYRTKSVFGEFDDIKTAYQKGIRDTLYALKMTIPGVNTYDQ